MHSLNKIDIKITNAILKRKGNFTVMDIINELNNDGLQVNVDDIRSRINELRDAGLVSDYGSIYSLSMLMIN